MERRLDCLVEGRVKLSSFCCRGSRREVRERARVPRHSKAVYIEKTIPNCDFRLSGWFGMDCRIVGEKLRKVVFVDLFTESMCRCYNG